MVCPRTPHPHEEGPEDENIIVFTPEKDAKIENIASAVLRAMKKLGMDAEIHFPHFVLEVPQGATVKNIIEAYHKVVPQYLPEIKPTQPRKPSAGPGR